MPSLKNNITLIFTITSMLALKQEALRTINAQPDDTYMDEIMYQLYITAKASKRLNKIKF